MPGPTVRKQNLRQQKATRRSERLAGKRQLVPPGGDDLQRDSEMQDEPSSNHPIPTAASFIERLPSELILLIAKQLPVESRITLALTSHIMMGKLGGISSTAGELKDWPGSDATPRMLLLELLERDSLLLTRCHYCRALRSVLWPGDPHGAESCGNVCNALTTPQGRIIATLPLVRRAVLWNRRGHDAGLLLANVCRSYVGKSFGCHYDYLVDYQARAVGDSVILREQLFVARNAPCAQVGHPTALDLATLDRMLCSLMPSLCNNLGSIWHMLEDMKTAECRTNPDKRHYHNHKCYRDDVGPPRRALSPTLRCLLTHALPCRFCCSEKQAFLGRVDGSTRNFLDYSANSIPVAEPDYPWDRVLVFTSWRDLGDGSSQYDARWKMRPGTSLLYMYSTPEEAHKQVRKDSGGRVGDAYERYEGVVEGTPYVPRLSRAGARKLFAARTSSRLYCDI